MGKIDFKKLDEMDILIKSEPMTPKERAAFSKFLKEYKTKNAVKIQKLKAKKKTPPKVKTNRRLDFVIDKLTSSIENTLTSERFETDVV